MDRDERAREILEASSKAYPWIRVAFMPPGLEVMNAVQRLGASFQVPRLPLNIPKFPVISLGLSGNPLLGGLDWVSKFTAPMLRFTEAMTRAGRELRLLDEAGWLPHYTTPFDDLEGFETAEEVARFLEAHYRECWSDVRASLEAHLDLYAVDDVAKGAFRKAFDLHQDGYYGAAVLYVFPAIERLARQELHQGRLSGFASQPQLRELAGQLYADQIEPGGFRGMALYQCLDDHLYSQLKTTEALETARLDPVPNRHAAIHGLIDYDTHQSSVNALIMADYVLQVFTAVKADVGCSDAAA